MKNRWTDRIQHAAEHAVRTARISTLKWAAVMLVCAMIVDPGRSMGQDTEWLFGNSRVTLPTAGVPVFSEHPLPQPGGTLNYSGSSADLTAQIFRDQFGNMLAFLVNGNVYDRKGYLIADADDLLGNKPIHVQNAFRRD